MSRLPPLRHHSWTLPRHERRWYFPLRVDGRRGLGDPRHYLVIYPGQVRISRCFDGAQVDAVHNLAAADVRERRRHLRAYLRSIGVPGRIIREVCGGLHRGERCWGVPCPGAAWRVALGEVLP